MIDHAWQEGSLLTVRIPFLEQFAWTHNVNFPCLYKTFIVWLAARLYLAWRRPHADIRGRVREKMILWYRLRLCITWSRGWDSFRYADNSAVLWWRSCESTCKAVWIGIATRDIWPEVKAWSLALCYCHGENVRGVYLEDIRIHMERWQCREGYSSLCCCHAGRASRMVIFQKWNVAALRHVLGKRSTPIVIVWRTSAAETRLVILTRLWGRTILANFSGLEAVLDASLNCYHNPARFWNQGWENSSMPVFG